MLLESFKKRLKGLAADTFQQVLSDARVKFLDRKYKGVQWSNIFNALTQDDRIDKMIDYYGRDGWTQLLEVLDDACKTHTPHGLVQ